MHWMEYNEYKIKNKRLGISLGALKQYLNEAFFDDWTPSFKELCGWIVVSDRPYNGRAFEDIDIFLFQEVFNILLIGNETNLTPVQVSAISIVRRRVKEALEKDEIETHTDLDEYETEES